MNSKSINEVAMAKCSPANEARACNCIGPQGSAPVCPCQMTHVKVIGGRYILTRDLGPAQPTPAFTVEAYQSAPARR